MPANEWVRNGSSRRSPQVGRTAGERCRARRSIWSEVDADDPQTPIRQVTADLGRTTAQVEDDPDLCGAQPRNH